ncbi:LytR C-terminal domain-containing protein [Arcanobacterium hippocoleae]
MADIQNHYETDEFDELAKQRQTYGAHRVRRKKYGWLIAVILIAVLAPVAGVLAGEWLSHSEVAQETISQAQKGKSDRVKSDTADKEQNTAGDTGTDQKADSKAAVNSEDTEDSKTAAGAQSEKEKEKTVPSPEPKPAPEPVIALNTPLSVLNATNISGLAREKTQLLRNAGFTKVSASNYTGPGIQRSTVYYGDAALADTAKKVAASLGIAAAVENANMVRAGTIVVVLKSR